MSLNAISAVRRISDRHSDEELLFVLMAREKVPPVSWRAIGQKLGCCPDTARKIHIEIETDYAESLR